MKSTREMILVMQAYEDGSEIEYRRKNVYGLGKWGYDEPPAWDWITFDYRIKPKEKKKVKLYKYAYKSSKTKLWEESSTFYEDDADFIYNHKHWLYSQRLDYTMIEVEE